MSQLPETILRLLADAGRPLRRWEIADGVCGSDLPNQVVRLWGASLAGLVRRGYVEQSRVEGRWYYRLTEAGALKVPPHPPTGAAP